MRQASPKSLLSFDWVPSLRGIAANELADAVARHYASSVRAKVRLPAAVQDFWDHPLLSWTWALFDENGRPSLDVLVESTYELFDPVLPEHSSSVVEEVVNTSSCSTS